jgi:hypothetical protein
MLLICSSGSNDFASETQAQYGSSMVQWSHLHLTTWNAQVKGRFFVVLVAFKSTVSGLSLTCMRQRYQALLTGNILAKSIK